MSVTFTGGNRQQALMFPPNVSDWLPEGHLARFVVEIVEQLDISAIKNEYGGRGSKAYDPEMMIALLFYGYATGVFSSRKIEKSTYDSVAFRYITGNCHPDHDTIASFRRRFLPHLQNIFVQILHIAHEMKVLRLGGVSLDGTKIKANASKHKALSYGRACQLEKQLQAEIEMLLNKAEEIDNSRLPDDFSIPDEIARREDRLKKIKEAKIEIEARAAARHAEEQKAYAEKVAKREEKEKKTGRKPGGKPPTPPTSSGPTDKDQISLTDPDSRIMGTTRKGFKQAYNAQAGVDTATQMIICNHVSQHPNDKKELKPALEELNRLKQKDISVLLADTGYFSETNCELLRQAGITGYVAAGRMKHNKYLDGVFSGTENTETMELPLNTREAMQQRLRTTSGKMLYAARKTTIEPVFGIIKHVLGFRRFSLRGFEKVQAEWSLISTAWNMKRMFSLAT